MRRLTTLLPLLSLAACVSAPPPPPAVATPIFSLVRFFDGHSEGVGTVRAALRKDQTIHVHSRGVIEPGGTLRLDQVIDYSAKPAERRLLRVREVSTGRYAGTASDAEGPLAGERQGNRLHFSYVLKGGYRTDQWMALRPDGRTVDNLLVLHKAGGTVAVIRETIRKTG